MNSEQVKAVRRQSKEKRLEYYFKCPGLVHRDELDLTEADVREYQQLKEKEVSMKPTEKRNILVKQMLRPLLKSRGFKFGGNTWWKELEDSWLIIHLKNSLWNGYVVGACFSFEISVSYKYAIEDKLTNQWIYNQFCSLCQSDFLPYCGYLSPHMAGSEYKIDGYRNYLPLDEPLDEIMEQVRRDFETYILPALCQIRTMADWDNLYREMRVRNDEPDMRLLRYYNLAHDFSCSKYNIPNLISIQEELNLTPEMITSHFDWLEIIRKNSSHTYLDSKSFILKVLENKKYV